MLLGNCPLDRWNKTGENFVNKACKENNTIATVKHGGDSGLFWGYWVASDAESLKSAQDTWSLKTITTLWREMYSPVSESSISDTGQNTQLKHPKMNKTSECPDVSSNEPWSESYRPSMERTETCSVEKAAFKRDSWSSLLRRYEPDYLLTGVDVSQGATAILCLQWVPLTSVQWNIRLRVPSRLPMSFSFVSFKIIYWIKILHQSLIFTKYGINDHERQSLLAVSSYFRDNSGLFLFHGRVPARLSTSVWSLTQDGKAI